MLRPSTLKKRRKTNFMMKFKTQSAEFSAGDMLIVAGDWNARPGPVDMATQHFALGPRCANGGRLVHFASANRLAVSSPRLQHPRHHRVTWFSNDGRTRNQVHHRLVLSHWTSSVMLCQTYYRTQTCSENGHAMVCACVRPRLKASQLSYPATKLNTANWKTTAL